tara:strand:+ start:312 stop:542 length:231 start_codon:yes stop_codon:yes gene_type:complete
MTLPLIYLVGMLVVFVLVYIWATVSCMLNGRLKDSRDWGAISALTVGWPAWLVWGVLAGTEWAITKTISLVAHRKA